MSGTAYFFHPDSERHDSGAHHPERNERTRLVHEAISASGLLDRVDFRRPNPASAAQIDRVHEDGYRHYIEEACLSGQTIVDTGDTHVGHDSYDAALLAAGAACQAVDAVLGGEARNAFCNIRPPGHHARPRNAMGFCLFNSIAIAARHAQEVHGLDRILIIDWDVHHGNGTQEMFYEDPTIFFLSTHQYPFYPGTGAADERGSGKGRGATLNIPMGSGTGGRIFDETFNGRVADTAITFKPDLILLSAGFDAHRDDPLAGLLLEDDDFRMIGETLVTLANECCSGRFVSILEGGYNMKALQRCAVDHLKTLLK